MPQDFSDPAFLTGYVIGWTLIIGVAGGLAFGAWKLWKRLDL